MQRILVAAALVAALVGALAVAGPATATAGIQEDFDPDGVLMSIAVAEDGEAAWTIEYRIELETDEDRQAFEDLRDDIDSDPEPYVDRFHERMNGTAASAEETTGREMRITEVTVAAEKRELPREYGVVIYEFRWTNFAVVDGDRIYVGDAIDGLFFDEDNVLHLSWPDEYALLEASPSPTERQSDSVRYDGPTNFESGEPRLKLGPPGAAPSSDTGWPLPVSPASLAAIVALAFAGVGGFAIYRRRDAVLADADEPAGETDVDAATDRDLLSNEEQVLQLVERHGGRIKQQDVAAELEWTDAKTSKVTKRLREEGQLEGFRLGRENVLALPNQDED